jgi:hypothetical protein
MTSRREKETAIGCILRRYGLTEEELANALEYKAVNSEMRLGEICVALGYLPQWVIDAALRTQRASRIGTVALMRLATSRTRSMHGSLASLAAMAERKKGEEP